MSGRFREKVRKEIELYLEEEREKEYEKQLAREEKSVKQLPYIVATSSLIMSIFFLSLGISDPFDYLMYFLPLFVVANIISYFIFKGKSHPRVKSMLFILPLLVHVIGVLLPTVIFMMQ